MNTIHEAITATRVLSDWLGDGGVPVDRDVAESRAKVCTGAADGVPCPLNKQPGWWDAAKGTVAMAMRRQMEVKHKMTGRLPNEGALGICTACGCCLPLKVWVPLKHIAAHTDSEALPKFPSFCWIRTEMDKQTP